MKDNMLKYYKVIGEISSSVSKADTLDQALKDALHVILTGCEADYAVLWFHNEADNKLHPYYWICSTDLTSMVHGSDTSDVWKCFEAQEAIRHMDYEKGTDPCTDSDFSGIPISSALCVPLSNKYHNLGTIQFLKKDGVFTEETADICEMLSLLLAIQIEDDPKFQKPWQAGNTLISVRGVEKSFLNGTVTTQVLKGVNLDVYEGEFLVLLGESGCGKSTLLNIIGGMDSADTGSIMFIDHDIANANEEELTKLRRDNIGFIFQSYNLMPNLNAKQNLNLIGELVEDPMDAMEALELVGLSDRADNYPSQLSGGQQQRISIARALIKKPRLIFADEPTAALDYTTSIEVLEVLEKIVGTGTTMVMVTHNEEITRMADRVVRMRNGQVYEVTVNPHPVHAGELVW